MLDRVNLLSRSGPFSPIQSLVLDILVRMIKDKLEKCAESSGSGPIKEEPTSCDSAIKDTGGNDNVTPKKEDDSSPSSSSTPTNAKESSTRSSSSGRPTNSTTNGMCTTVSTPNGTSCPPNAAVGCAASLPTTDSTDVGGMLDSNPDPPPGGAEDPALTDRPPLPPDLQSENFADLGTPPLAPLRQPPMMQHVRPSPNGIQPLVSNVINKQSGSMEVQYMQQQSQIFVFSTMLANKSADAVFQGHFQSIIAYHCAQPGTKKYFEKHPLKLTQFNRQSPAQWLNGLAMMKNKGCTRGSIPGPGAGPGMPPGMPNFQPKGPPIGGMVEGFPGPEGIVDDIASLQDSDVPWDQRNNHPMGLPMENRTGSGPSADGDAALDDPCLAGGSPATGPDSAALMLGHSPCITSTAPTSPSLANLQPSLQGVKVPDEDLTPQQRQHREEQLATIRKMQQMLFPEENAPMGIGGPDDHEMSGPNPGGEGPGGPPPCQGMMPGPPPTSMAGHMDWQKIQNQFFDGKMKPQGGMGDHMGPGHGHRGLGPVPPSGPQGPGSVLSPQVPGGGAGPRLQGPPPPYHQTPRSASVPIALQSPNPASPNNPTSNLSLPSPRTSSGLNSPADSNNRQFSGLGRHFSATQSPTSQSSPSAPVVRSTNTVSNPGTPISSHFSPSSAPAGDQLPTATASSGSAEFPGNGPAVTPSHHGSVDGMFCRTLQSMAQKQHLVGGVPGGDVSGSPNKEPNLMPVPSPQQIQYCNTFDGQELTIQKQPNTSLKDRSLTSPPSLDGGGFPNEMCSGGGPGARVSAPNTPLTPSSVDMGPRFPLTSSNPSSDCYRIPAPSPSSADSKNPRPSPQSVGNRQPDMKPGNPDPGNLRFSSTSPMDGHNRFPMMGMGGSPNSFPPQQPPGNGPKTGGNILAVSPSGKPTGPMDAIANSGQRADNVPLNPNSNNGLPGNPKGSHFDPISSLAQMSQLLTSTVSSSLNGQSGGPGGSMMPYGGVNAPPMDMSRSDMGGCVPDMDGGMMGMPGPPHVYNPAAMGSPKNMPFMPPQRMMRPNMGQGPIPYNGTNVQVKASAPNTIQYLPARPQMGPTNPRGPPSLDFLQRFANPNMESKMPGGQNMQYFPCGPNSNMGHMDGGGMHNDGLMASLMNGPMMGKMPMSGGMVPQGMMPMGMPGAGMRNPGALRPGMNNSIRMHGGMGGFDPSGMGDGMYPPPGGPQMFGPPGGAKGGPMGRGMCAPDATQPLPPSVGQANAYKTSPFGSGATTADPNYAQQFHNFQQQLYATSTRSQLNSQGPGPPQAPPSNNHMYFMSK